MGSINEHIIRDFSVGQEKAFRILYEKYAPALRYFAAKYVEEGEVIDDIVQDVFVCLWEKRVDFKTEETIKAFLYKAVKNSCLNTIRHQGVKIVMPKWLSTKKNWNLFGIISWKPNYSNYY